MFRARKGTATSLTNVRLITRFYGSYLHVRVHQFACILTKVDAVWICAEKKKCGCAYVYMVNQYMYMYVS